jgi:hypothetical protein
MAERAGATTADVPGCHAVYVSQPTAVAGLITQAAQSVARTPADSRLAPQLVGRQDIRACRPRRNTDQPRRIHGGTSATTQPAARS